MKSGENTMRYLWVTFGLLALGIIVYVLFQYPQPGVADQGDFDRVMNVSGLELKAENVNDPNFVRFLNYTVTDYKISDISMLGLLARLKATSMSYLITLVSLICKVFGQDTFKTGYLAIAYVIMYVFALFVIIKCLNIKNKVKLTLLVLITLFVFLDGNYLVWFNSLYGEPMMITTLMLYIAAWFYYIYNRNVLKSEEQVFAKIIIIFMAAFWFLGSKMQVLSALPIIMFMLATLFRENRRLLKQYQIWLLIFLSCLLIIYPVRFNLINKDISKDTQYNSVFYGILKDSKSPTQDLIDMGLNPDMAVEAGKHAFLDKGEYLRYVPHSEITQEEFYNKISNIKLVKFYITHPSRFIQGMNYTASQTFLTTTVLGKYQRKYSETPVREFNRFTLWSSFREHHFPKNLLFLIMMYIVILTVSIIIYVKNKGFQEIKAKIQLLWGIMFIGLIQFPMPYLGNGQADTSKQLYLFNFVFDVIIVVSVSWCFNKFIDFCYMKMIFKKDKYSLNPVL
ncbi:MAG: hypothetical protein CVU90_11225 [Firmicutes bacterium HGW-Firmicutes-15]|nr:MAG: hypothetical protein CVU90_11225 [Firmicutes bacterium HGW-Firmicutes-15]